MVLSSKKFIKLQKKVEKKLIGNYGSNKGLGQDLIVKKYSYVTNERGDKIETYISDETCKGIVIASDDFSAKRLNTLKIGDSNVILYIPIGVDVEDTEELTYKFVYDNKVWLLEKKNDIGQVTNIQGVVREITLKPEP